MKCLLLIALLPLATHAWVKEMENAGHWQGDMELTPEQMEAAQKGKFTFGSIKTRLWTKVGNTVTIPYTTDGTIGSTAKAQKALKVAFADYHKFTCLRFVPRRNELAYIHFKDGLGCSSPVGTYGRQNTITLGKGCWSKATVIHEIGHSIGLHHEQSRPDRDGYIKVHWENIPDDVEYNFKKQSYDRVDSRGTPYDYRSVMQYSKTAFGDGKVTMETTDKYFTDLLGIGSGFSDIDVEQINKMYNCPTYNGVVEKVKQTPDCHDSGSYCAMWVAEKANNCRWLGKRCPFSCKKCRPGGGPMPTTAPPPTQTPPPTHGPGYPCKDKAANCTDYKGKCQIPQMIPSMKYWCKKYCNYC